MANIRKLFPSGRFVLIDGGLGSTLEDVFHVNTTSSLWSSVALAKDPESVIQAHLIFLRAGARLIETASYQGAFSTYAKAGYSEEDAERLMRSSVALADEARRRYVAESGVPADSIKVALSLAGYGATLSLPHEFDGFYPPPYGPQAYAPPPATTRTAFAPDEHEAAAGAEDALAAFHLERLRVFADDAPTWRAIDALAFETVPLAREVRALRRAVATLEGELAPADRKPWWVTVVWPEGRFPEESTPGGARLGAAEVLAAYFDDVIPGAGIQGARYAVPDAFGINCTAPAHVASAVAEASEALAVRGVGSGVGGGQPWLVLKPNGGQTYDMSSRKWGWHDGQKQTQGDEFANELGAIVHRAAEKNVWGGILVGGCCKTGDEELRALSKVLGV
ncbi:Homocysteine S-methyltransferase [Gloeopeniophorella convolvens]|nr:Homocysteine S-methyltransferase [Gloeopeniophorella convolvens]